MQIGAIYAKRPIGRERIRGMAKVAQMATGTTSAHAHIWRPGAKGWTQSEKWRRKLM